MAVTDWQLIRADRDRRALSDPLYRIRRFPAPYRDALVIFGLALGLRLVFSILIANTYDADEFVYLALGRDVAHGAVPYQDFPFFHPPGILVLLGFLNPLTAVWWPLVRLVDVLVDCVTATLVWHVGLQLYGRRTALMAGALYAVNPVTLVSAVRVDQEVIITALGMLGLALLVTRRSNKAALLAGACLAAACWVKYPAAVFLPVYLLATPRRFFVCLLGFLGTSAALFFPYLADLHRLYNETVTWQLFLRADTPLPLRLVTIAVFWLGVNPFAVGALLKPAPRGTQRRPEGTRRPLWIEFGFATGCLFVFTSSAYSHYFVPVAPFGALLGAPLAARLLRIPFWGIALGCLGVASGWATGMNLAAQRYPVVSRFSDISPVIQFIDRSTPPQAPILGDCLQFAYLAPRPWVAHYFWDDDGMISAQALERSLAGTSLVVLSLQHDQYAYPAGFTAYLDAHYQRLRRSGMVIWMLRPLRTQVHQSSGSS